jgi:hypothetical protein
MTCERCQGSGWIIVERNGLSGAERCPCSVSRKSKADSCRPTLEQITGALAKIAESDVVPFFPKTVDGWIMMASEIASFIQDVEGLGLLVRMVLRHAKKYEGVSGLRQIYCAYAAPADGIYPAEPLAGFSTEECHIRHSMLDQAARERQIEEYRLLAAGRATPFQLPAVRSL